MQVFLHLYATDKRYQGFQQTFLGYDCKGYALGIGEVGYIAIEGVNLLKNYRASVIGGMYGIEVDKQAFSTFIEGELKAARKYSFKKSSAPNILDKKMEDICIFDFKTKGTSKHSYAGPKDGDLVLYFDSTSEWTHAARYDSSVCEDGLSASKLGVIHGLYCHPIIDNNGHVLFSEIYGDTVVGITSCDNFNGEL